MLRNPTNQAAVAPEGERDLRLIDLADKAVANETPRNKLVKSNGFMKTKYDNYGFLKFLG